MSLYSKGMEIATFPKKNFFGKESIFWLKLVPIDLVVNK